MILGTCLVEFYEVNTHSTLPILLAYNDNVGKPVEVVYLVDRLDVK